MNPFESFIITAATKQVEIGGGAFTIRRLSAAEDEYCYGKDSEQSKQLVAARLIEKGVQGHGMTAEEILERLPAQLVAKLGREVRKFCELESTDPN